MVRKHSRGKSGRYCQFWIYLPRHKRFNWILRQIAANITFQPHKKFIDRLAASLSDLIANIDTHFIYRNTLEAYNVIFKSFKRSLIKSYRRQQKKLEQK